MTTTITLAFLHHVTAFLVLGTLMVELVVLRGELNLASARSVLRMDLVYGIAATLLLVVGLLRVFYTEKGAAYYFASGTFIAKLVLFVLIGLLSIYPTLKFLGWRAAVREQRVPVVDAATIRTVRIVIHAELTLIVIILLLAPLMARGVGFFG